MQATSLMIATGLSPCPVQQSTQHLTSRRTILNRFPRPHCSKDGTTSNAALSTVNLREELTNQEWNLLPEDTKKLPKDDAAPSEPVTSVAYILRFFTGLQRESGLSDTSSGVWICLIGQEGKSFLHRVSPIYDPQESDDSLADFGEMIDASHEEDFLDDFNSSDVRPSDDLSVVQRFQQGDVDEVSFVGPDMGPIRGLLIGPESGSWRVDEVTLLTSNSKKTEKFVCRDQLGGKRGDGAALLFPISQDAVLYGSGQTAMTLTKEEAADVRKGSLDEYSSFKSRVLLTTVGLVVGGGVVTAATKGFEAAYPFSTGGAIGILYQWLLQKGVDLVKLQPGSQQRPGKVTSTPDETDGSSETSSTNRIIGSQYFRFGTIILAASMSYFVYQSIVSDPVLDSIDVLSRYSRLQFIVASGLGFFMYKVALVFISVLPEDSDNTEKKEIS